LQACLVNGRETVQLSVNDRGLLYGDGVFETMSVVDGELPLLSYHLERLRCGCERLGIACPSADLLQAEIVQLSANSKRAVLKLILTRGEAGRGYVSTATAVPTRILQRHSWPATPRRYWDSGVRVRFCRLRLALQPALAGIKHLNRLEQILARAEWQDENMQEGLLCDSEGYIVEGVSHNLFLVNGDELITPDLTQTGVAGVMRAYILSQLPAQGIHVRIEKVTPEAVLAADGLFLCNSVHGIWPICEIDAKPRQQNRLVCELRDRIARIIPYP
jgi:4-amino-4-deoxychorismate lyase